MVAAFAGISYRRISLIGFIVFEVSYSFSIGFKVFYDFTVLSVSSFSCLLRIRGIRTKLVVGRSQIGVNVLAKRSYHSWNSMKWCFFPRNMPMSSKKINGFAADAAQAERDFFARHPKLQPLQSQLLGFWDRNYRNYKELYGHTVTIEEIMVTI